MTREWHRDGRVHASIWIITLGLAVWYDATRHVFALTRFLLVMLATVLVHEAVHWAVARRLGWSARFILSRRSHWAPAVSLDPPGPLWAGQYAVIALAPVMPSVLMALWLGGVTAGVVALLLSIADLKLMLDAWRRERQFPAALTLLDRASEPV